MAHRNCTAQCFPCSLECISNGQKEGTEGKEIKKLMYHEIFKTLVIELKLVDYEYFMDKMQEYEVYMFYDNLKYTDRPDWE